MTDRTVQLAERTPTPLQVPTTLMSFPTGNGNQVSVTAHGRGPMPYQWKCPAGHGGDSYASLPFCRDDAKAHAAKCQGADTADRLVAAVGAWASRPHRQTATIEGFQLLNVLRIHARPIHRLRDLDTESDRLRRLARKGAVSYDVHQAAEKAANDAYAVAMQDVYDVFEVITGVSPDANHGLMALNLKVSLVQIAEAARTLAVSV